MLNCVIIQNDETMGFDLDCISDFIRKTVVAKNLPEALIGMIDMIEDAGIDQDCKFIKMVDQDLIIVLK